MPDALSKTVPIWITVLNRLLFPDHHDSHVLHTPEDVVSRSEHVQIEQLLSKFVSELEGLDLDTETLRKKLDDKPLEPMWVTPAKIVSLSPPQTRTRHPIILCTASSQRSLDGNAFEHYVQGAADDSESWACKLNPATFWNHNNELLATLEDDLPEMIEKLLKESPRSHIVTPPVLIKPTNCLYIAMSDVADHQVSSHDIVVSNTESTHTRMEGAIEERHIRFTCASGKIGSRQLRGQLLRLAAMSKMLHPDSKIFVRGSSGADIVIGLALTILGLHFDGSGMLDMNSSTKVLNKAEIKRRLSWIVVSMPEAAPSRATLQSVNAFLLGER
jgi:tRNA A64-2'-O-ribosylphosphate transferase